MFEYRGWITVRETPGEDEDDVRLRQVVDQLRLRIAWRGTRDRARPWRRFRRSK
ncbi:Imm7 family immunity protein [Streptomyces sp. NPDC090741]|uniref:Imm7 family immunity protein n=1 Tax=Streptomyces sp. NPDC090741 TaxID=3365967 RepID=UPI00383015EF